MAKAEINKETTVIKFTEEEVNSINGLRQEVANVFTQLGQVAIEKKRRMKEGMKEEQESAFTNQYCS